MKKLLLLILLTTSPHFLAQQTYVPDDNFEQSLIDFGYDNVLDDYVLTTNISSITDLGLSDKNISDLTGIEDFISLEFFACMSNQITSVDISHNTLLTTFLCWDNQITSLDVSKLSFLVELDCAINQLEFLDIRNGNNTNIDYFNAEFNPNLTCIFVDDATWSETNWISIDPAATFVETQAECDAIGVDEDAFENDISIYPNPTHGSLFIENPMPNVKLQITITSTIGKVRSYQYAVGDTGLNISNLPQGIYYLIIKSDKQTLIKKIIKV